jgi:HSP20 family protein
MKDHMYFDLGKIMDELFNAAENFSNVFQDGFDFGPHMKERNIRWGDKVDFYPAYSYPPTNVFFKTDRTLVFEFALAGFGEDNIDLQFKGDYMTLSATVSEEMKKEEEVKYLKRRLKFKDIKEQKYYVPEEKFDRENCKASYKYGILKIEIPPNEGFTTQEGIKVEIVKEGE